MSYGTTSIDPGTSPSVGVASDAIASVVYQRIKLADATEGATTGIGIAGNPLKVQPRRLGTADYDSGNSAVPSSLTAVTASTIYPEGGYVTNIGDVDKWFTVTNTAGDEVCSRLVIAARSTVRLPFAPGMALVGLKWQAETVSCLRAQVWGAQ